MKTLATAAFLLLAPAAQASELIFGLGATDFNSDLAPNDSMVSVEYHADPFRTWERAHAGWGAAIVAHTRGDLWVGAGVYGRQMIDDNWFVEGSFMPGLYAENSQATDLGSTIEFRTVLAVGYKVSDKAAVSLAVDHRSNASISDFNPGVNGLSLRFHRDF